MAKTITLNNGLAAVTYRENLISYFTELYAYGVFTEKIARSTGTPSTGDPAGLSTISHTITGYTAAPVVIPIPKCDWHIYVSSVSSSEIVIGVGSYGSGTTLDYDLLLIKEYA